MGRRRLPTASAVLVHYEDVPDPTETIGGLTEYRADAAIRRRVNRVAALPLLRFLIPAPT